LTSAFARAGFGKVASVELVDLSCISTGATVEMQRTLTFAYDKSIY